MFSLAHSNSAHSLTSVHSFSPLSHHLNVSFNVFRPPVSIVDQQSGEAAVVDPADPAVVQRAAKHAGVNITAILTTHHHA